MVTHLIMAIRAGIGTGTTHSIITMGLVGVAIMLIGITIGHIPIMVMAGVLLIIMVVITIPTMATTAPITAGVATIHQAITRIAVVQQAAETMAAWTREQQETAPTIAIKAAEARVRRAVVMAMDTNAATMATSPTRGLTTITATTTRPLAATTAVRAVVRSAVEAHTAVEVRSVVAIPVARNPAEAEHLVADAKQRQ